MSQTPRTQPDPLVVSIVRYTLGILGTAVGILFLLTGIALTNPAPDEATVTWDIDTISDAPLCESETQTADCFWYGPGHGDGTSRTYAVVDGQTVYLDELGE